MKFHLKTWITNFLKKYFKNLIIYYILKNRKLFLRGNMTSYLSSPRYVPEIPIVIRPIIRLDCSYLATTRGLLKIFELVINRRKTQIQIKAKWNISLFKFSLFLSFRYSPQLLRVPSSSLPLFIIHILMKNISKRKSNWSWPLDTFFIEWHLMPWDVVWTF